MPASKSELWNQVLNAIKLIDNIYKFGAENTPNFNTLKNTLFALLEGDHVPNTSQIVNNIQSQLSAMVLLGRSILTPLITELARIGYSINTTGKTIEQIIDLLCDAMVAASGETVASRDITFGSVSAGGSNVSTGQVYRTTLDKNNQKIEGGQVGVVKLEITKDKNSGALPGREEYRIYGSGITKVDEIDVGTATNLSSTGFVASVRDSLLKNSDFAGIQETITTTEQNGWTLDSTSGITRNTTIRYRWQAGREGVVSPKGYSLALTADNAVSQYFTRESLGSRIDINAPFFLIFPYYRDGVDGQFQIRLGASTTTVADLTAVSDTTWLFATIGPGTDDGYFKNFNEDWVDTTGSLNQALGIRVKAELSSRTTGTLYIASPVLAQPKLFNGCWYLIFAGSNTQSTSGEARVGDFWTFTDAYTTGGVAQGRTQDIIRKMYPGKYLPHTTGVETYADA